VVTATPLGAALIAAITAEMADEGVTPTAMENALLRTAGQLVNRLAALEAVVERDGEILVSKTGVTRVHPAISEHRQVAATLPKVLAGIVVGDSATGPAKNPVKQRAANQRWANRDRIREAQIRRAEEA
jgi:hypothetical protein